MRRTLYVWNFILQPRIEINKDPPEATIKLNFIKFNPRKLINFDQDQDHLLLNWHSNI